MRLDVLGLGLASAALLGGVAAAADTTITIESWRTDDLGLWQEKIIPAFEAKHTGNQSRLLANRTHRIQRSN